MTNASSSFAGTFATYSTGQILYATDNWGSVFGLIAIVYFATTAVYLAWASSDNQFDNLDTAEEDAKAMAIPKGPWR